MAPIYLQRLLPTFCHTLHATMIQSIRKASFGLVRKMIYYIQSPLLLEMVTDEDKYERQLMEIWGFPKPKN